MVYDLISESSKNLRRAGIRTYLTLLGVIIGIAAIVSLLSIGTGLGVSVEQQLESLGGQTIFVIPGGIQNIRISLNENDISNLKNLSGVDSVVPIYTTSAVLEFNDEKINVSVSATDVKDAELFADTGFFDVSEGRDFANNESGAVLIGSNIANNYFEKKINVRKQVQINGEDFRVIGILKPQAQSFGGGPDTGGTVYMSLDAFKRISSNLKPGIIFVTAANKIEVNDVVDEIKNYFDKKYGEGSVNALSSEQILESVNSLLSIITLFIASLAGISLIVGGVGIMNAMITSVLERTKEIGLYKSLGASNNKILTIFILEAAFIGLIGGIIGTLIGFGLAELIAIIGTESGYALVAVKSVEIVALGLGFSVVVGIVSGFYPALRAARLDPVEALRYE
ncbi:MAG: ABC transporter permease [archaeon]|jgi:putative ABC transport system permease protein